MKNIKNIKNIVIILTVIMTLFSFSYKVIAVTTMSVDGQIAQTTTNSNSFDNTWYIPKTLKYVPGNIYKAESGHNENGVGNYFGGVAGDQTGDETVIKPFRRRWKTIYSI